MNPDETNQITKIAWKHKDLDESEFHLLHSRQTEVVVFGPKNLRKTPSSYRITLNGITLAFSTTVRNLSVILGQDLSFDLHMKQVSGTIFFHLHNFPRMKSILSQSDTEKLVQGFVTSRLDYCNSRLLLCFRNVLKSLHLIQTLLFLVNLSSTKSVCQQTFFYIIELQSQYKTWTGLICAFILPLLKGSDP